MRTKADTVEQEMYNKGRGVGSTEGTLFGGGSPAATDTPAMVDVERALIHLANNRGDYGITADDVIRLMREKGLAWRVDRKEQRRFSSTGRFLKDMERRGLLSSKRHSDGSPVMRKSERKGAHSNRQIVYVGAR